MLTLLAQAPAAGPVNMIDIQAQIATISPVATVGMLVQLGAGAILVIGALAVLYFLLRGGLGWILAGGEKAKVEEARTMITQAIIGMVILASVFALFGVLLDFFGLRSRINIGNYGGGTATGGTGGTGGGACISCPGGTCPDGWQYGPDTCAPQATCPLRATEACLTHQLPGGGGTTPICTAGASGDDGGAGGYCLLNGQPSSARVFCRTTAGIPYPHWEPCSCLQAGAVKASNWTPDTCAP